MRNVLLNLCQKCLDDARARERARLPTRISEDNSTLTTADFSRVKLGQADVTLLAKALARNTHLRKLFLGATGLGLHGMQVLSFSLSYHPSLEEVHLGGNNIGDEGLRIFLPQLAEANSTLRKLALNSNNITDAGVPFITDFLKVTKIERLWLWLESNDFGKKSSYDIQRVLDETGKCFLQVCCSGYWDLIESSIREAGDPPMLVVTESSHYVEEEREKKSQAAKMYAIGQKRFGQLELSFGQILELAKEFKSERSDCHPVRGASGELGLAIKKTIFS